jgi:hypothetical protein
VRIVKGYASARAVVVSAAKYVVMIGRIDVRRAPTSFMNIARGAAL